MEGLAVIRALGDKKPKIHQTALDSESADEVGDVELGEGSSKWPGTIKRATGD